MKSRTLPFTEYLKILQLEYFSCRVRSLIYEQDIFVKMNHDIAEKKKDKIIELGKKFQTLTIFDSIQIASDFWKREFVREYGLPNFQYGPDETKKEKVSNWDKFYLLRPKNVIVYKEKEYQVKENFPETNSLVVSILDEDIILPYIWVKIKDLMTPFDKRMM